jgi:hypothetical protein
LVMVVLFVRPGVTSGLRYGGLSGRVPENVPPRAACGPA